jgi:hypothetical protein
MKSILLMSAVGLSMIMALSFCSSAEGTKQDINYIIHYENGTILSVDQNSPIYAALNYSIMKYLEFIAYASERLVTPDELMNELNGTKYLEMKSKDPMTIQTKEGLNPGWPQGYEIVTKKIIIKLGEAEAEERIFTFHDEGIPVRAWRSALEVSTISF